MGNNINGENRNGNNMNNNFANGNSGINLSNLFDLSRIGNLFNFSGNRRMNNPLNQLGRMFGGNNNYQRQNRNIVTVLPIEEAYRRVKNGNCFLLDVRTEMEYNTLRIKGSVNVPLDKLQENIPNIVTNKGECIIVYCATGSRVRRAVQILWSLGYTNICIWEGAGINTFAFADLIVYNNQRGNKLDNNIGGTSS